MRRRGDLKRMRPESRVLRGDVAVQSLSPESQLIGGAPAYPHGQHDDGTWHLRHRVVRSIGHRRGANPEHRLHIPWPPKRPAALRTQIRHPPDGARDRTDADNNVSRFGYDEQGNQTFIRDPLGHETRFTFTDRGMQATRTLGLGDEGILGTADESTQTIDYTFVEIAQRVHGTDEAGQPIDETHVFGHDGHGSVRVLYDLAGTVEHIAQAFTFAAYGELLAVHGPDAVAVPSTARLTSLGYSGEHFDARAQQQYLRARWYDPASGRFNRLDPFAGNMQDPQSLHKYAYVHGDPISNTDPSGEISLGSVKIAMGTGVRMAASSARGASAFFRSHFGSFGKQLVPTAHFAQRMRGAVFAKRFILGSGLVGLQAGFRLGFDRTVVPEMRGLTNALRSISMTGGETASEFDSRLAESRVVADRVDDLADSLSVGSPSRFAIEQVFNLVDTQLGIFGVTASLITGQAEWPFLVRFALNFGEYMDVFYLARDLVSSGFRSNILTDPVSTQIAHSEPDYSDRLQFRMYDLAAAIFAHEKQANFFRELRMLIESQSNPETATEHYRNAYQQLVELGADAGA